MLQPGKQSAAVRLQLLQTSDGKLELTAIVPLKSSHVVCAAEQTTAAFKADFITLSDEKTVALGKAGDERKPLVQPQLLESISKRRVRFGVTVRIVSPEVSWHHDCWSVLVGPGCGNAL